MINSSAEQIINIITINPLMVFFVELHHFPKRIKILFNTIRKFSIPSNEYSFKNSTTGNTPYSVYFGGF